MLNGLNLKYMVLCSVGNEQRIKNVEKMKEQLPFLKVVMCSRETVFNEHVKSFDIEDDYDGLVMFEDDILLCNDFLKRLEKTLSGHENELVSMFESACSKAPLYSSYRKGRIFAWNQCNYYPKDICKKLADKSMMPKFKEFYFKRYSIWNYPIDTYIAFVLNYHKIDYYMAIPFLVQHLDLASNFKGRSRKRISKYFIDGMTSEELEKAGWKEE